MSQKKMKQFRREFRKRHGRTKSLQYELHTRNVKKVIKKGQQRRQIKSLIKDEKRKPKAERRPWHVVLVGIVQIGQEYLKKTTRIMSDDIRRQYQHDKKLFRYGRV